MATIANIIAVLARAKDTLKEMAGLGASVCENRYRCSKDPLHAWQALWWCHQGGAPIPDWVVDYLGRVAGKLIALQEGKGKPELPIARALEFSGYPQERKEQLQKEMNATWRVIELMREDLRQGRTFKELKEEPYFIQVGEELDVSKGTIRRWFKELIDVIDK